MLLGRDDVVALALFGSALQDRTSIDLWSDVDFLLVVEEHAFSTFYPSVEWLRDLGGIFAREQSENPFHGTTRICFDDFRRLDLVVTAPSKLRNIEAWTSIPFWRGTSVLFSHSPEVTQILSQVRTSPKLTPPTQTDFEHMTNHFWFKAMLAGYKVMRGDRLIALHLALGLIRDCCVLGMMLRDRATGTSIHREGGIGNSLVDDLQSTHDSYSAAGILHTIEQSAIQFDRLAQEWTNGYQPKSAPLLQWTAQIGQALNRMGNEAG